ncbi:hypothetical protein CCHR01_06916 [Colletotrichum chrysophilum]|uniref:Uncharacterized protein n=1 Tax=Colletotrichum chrysophilum TaxID=1836956 RepID=A0AAD9AM59_9PEZI|nr:hypothetical protein CCHR01_06916 [Colletotrichum chrysophilum]
MSNASLRTGRIESAASLACPPHHPTSALHLQSSPVPTGSGLASQEKLLMHTINPSPHTLPGPLSLYPTPLDSLSLSSPKGPNPPIIPSAQRDHHWVSLTAPQLGHPSPAYPISPGPLA